MTGATLLAKLQATGLMVAADGDALTVRPRELLTDELRAAIRTHKPELLRLLDAPDPATERRRTLALAILAEHPGWRFAIVVEASEPAIVSVAIRDLAYGELEIPAASYDARALLALLERHGSGPTSTMLH